MIFLLLLFNYHLFLYPKIVTITAAATTTAASKCRENLKWNVKNPTIIVGTNITDDDVNYSEDDRRYLNTPRSLYLDEQEQILYISNQNGAAIKQLYLKNLTLKNIITNSKDELVNPQGIFLNKNLEQIYVVEAWPYYRIRMWSTKQLNTDKSKTVVKLDAFNNDILSIWVDSEGSIYFLDRDNNRIIKALHNDDGTNKTRTVAVGGNGEGNGPNQLNFPHSMYLDEKNQVMYISNTWERTIRKWKLGSIKGEVIIGKSGGPPGDSPAFMNCPSSLTLDENNQQLYVVDTCNNRIQMFCLKQPSSYPLAGKTIIHLPKDSWISSIALDKTNFNLYVATVLPSTVTKYELETVIDNTNQAQLKKKISIKDKKKKKKIS